MNRTAVFAALAATSLMTTTAMADEAKHFRHGPHYAPYAHVRPVVVPAPVVRHVVPAPVVVNRHIPAYGYGPSYYNRGYWRNGRWIAPVVVGAAVLGTIAAANSYAYVAPAPAVTYVNPAPVYVTPAVAPRYVNDAFSAADRDGNGVVDKWEAGYNRDWDRWFYDIDVNRDGVLSREEIRAWSAARLHGSSFN